MTPAEIVGVRDLLDTAPLKPRDRLAVDLFFGFRGRPLTLAEIGRELGVSRSRASDYYHRALRVLRRWERIEGGGVCPVYVEITPGSYEFSLRVPPGRSPVDWGHLVAYPLPR